MGMAELSGTIAFTRVIEELFFFTTAYRDVYNGALLRLLVQRATFFRGCNGCLGVSSRSVFTSIVLKAPAENDIADRPRRNRLYDSSCGAISTASRVPDCALSSFLSFGLLLVGADRAVRELGEVLSDILGLRDTVARLDLVNTWHLAADFIAAQRQ